MKHFAVNNQETNRIANDAILSPRAMREIYLKGFEMVVKEANPWTVMSSYNKINGVYTSESYDLLTTILRKEWGYQGMVVTDWFGGRDAVGQVQAGNDLLMPGKIRQQDSIRQALKTGKLSMADVDRNVRRVLELILKTPRFKGYPYSEQPDLKAHASVTREAAAEGMILLKNDGKTLPLAADVRDIAVFGNTSYQFIAGGTGSGDVEEAYSVSLEEGLTGAGFILDKGLKQHYLDYIRAEEAKIDWKKYNHVTPPRIVECTLDEGLIRRKAEETDMAMITIGRNAGEYSDRKVKDDFELCADEREMLEKVTRIFHQEVSFWLLLFACETSAQSPSSAGDQALVFIVVQFHRELPRQLKSGDEAVDGSVFGNAVLGIDDLEYQPAFGFLQHLNQSFVAVLYFLPGYRKLRRSVEAVI